MPTIDVGNTFPQADNDEQILIVLRGEEVESIERVNPTLYQPYITYSKKEMSMLYVRLLNALYEMWRGSLLFYKRLRKDLEKWGLKLIHTIPV